MVTGTTVNKEIIVFPVYIVGLQYNLHDCEPSALSANRRWRQLCNKKTTLLFCCAGKIKNTPKRKIAMSVHANFL